MTGQLKKSIQIFDYVKRSLTRCRCAWANRCKMNLAEIESENMDWIQPAIYTETNSEIL